jgi:lipoprotein-anchoring transpeptidase ErfK/SrfK
MRRTLHKLLLTFALSLLFVLPGCKTQPNNPSNLAATPTPSPSPTISAAPENSQITLPLLDALLSQPSFVSELKDKVQVTDDQIESLRRIASAEVQRLREVNAEQQNGTVDDARTLALDRISEVIGDDKAKQLATFANDYTARGDDDSVSDETASGPNVVPTDTRVVVNIPAYRMDLFQNGALIKSYQIGIGFPAFPLPQGQRKAQSIIFNPTWTPPDSPWVASMKDVAPGERVEAGSSLNPLGPIKIPIGMPSLIHGGKPASKIGRFASHGCVGLTNAQVKDFAKLLLEASGTEVSDRAVAGFLANKTKTRVVKLSKTIPVELRYETIVVEDGKLHIYKDVYDKKTNTEEKLRQVLELAGVNFDNLSENEKEQALSALNSMSAKPKKVEYTKTSDQETAKKKDAKMVTVEVAALIERGYPAPVDLDTGSGAKTKPAKQQASND